jgi:proline iminopeptidase
MPGTFEDPLYPEIEPYESTYLPVGDGHDIYYEICGNRDGKPVLFLHGGPGAGCSPKQRRFFDPDYYKIVLFDQRGCGRSRPNAADDFWAALKNNNTQTLVEDCEALKKHLGIIGPWHTVLGGSWGTTLGLAYAQTYPESVDALVLRGVFTGEHADIDHAFNGGMAQHHPEAWEAFAGHIAETASSPAEAVRESENILSAYYRRLMSGDAKKANDAAKAFTRYELTVIKNETPQEMIEEYCADPTKLVPFAAFETHFMINHLFTRENELVDGCSKLRKTTRVRIVHGRNDFICRPLTAWRLAKALKAADVKDVKLDFVNGWGHHDSEPGVGYRMVVATDELR